MGASCSLDAARSPLRQMVDEEKERSSLMDRRTVRALIIGALLPESMYLELKSRVDKDYDLSCVSPLVTVLIWIADRDKRAGNSSVETQQRVVEVLTSQVVQTMKQDSLDQKVDEYWKIYLDRLNTAYANDCTFNPEKDLVFVDSTLTIAQFIEEVDKGSFHDKTSCARMLDADLDERGDQSV